MASSKSNKSLDFLDGAGAEKPEHYLPHKWRTSGLAESARTRLAPTLPWAWACHGHLTRGISRCPPAGEQNGRSRGPRRSKWVELKMKQQGQTAGFGCFHLPGQAILEFLHCCGFPASRGQRHRCTGGPKASHPAHKARPVSNPKPLFDVACSPTHVGYVQEKKGLPEIRFQSAQSDWLCTSLSLSDRAE